MRERLAAARVVFRPHLKTAKSIDVAREMISSRTGPATVSTLHEAEYFADAGVTNLIYGVGIAPAKLARVTSMRARGVDLAVILDSEEQARAVALHCRASGNAIPVLIEIDADGHRSGVAATDDATLLAIAGLLESNAELRGVLVHAGGSYALTDPAQLRAAARTERDAAVKAATTLRAMGYACPVVSIGSTPTALFAEDFIGVTEVRAGVFIFGDLYQVGLGTAAVDDLALSVLSTVIGHNQVKGWTIVDAGWSALSRDRSTATQVVDQGFGLVCDRQGRVYPDMIVASVNQEHGIIARRPGSITAMPELPIGSLVRLLPNHACATAMQHGSYHVLDDAARVVAVWPRISGW